MDILSLFASFQTLTTKTTIRRLGLIALALLSMTGRVTQLSISRWTEAGGSYRTVQRFFATRLPWAEMLCQFFQTHFFNPTDEYLLAGDATTITKAGRETAGIGHFFSSVVGKAVRGLEFFVFSVVSLRERKSYPVLVRQTIRSTAEEGRLAARKKTRRQKKKKRAKKSAPKKLAGRPQGALNKDKAKLELSDELERINESLKRLLKLLRVFVRVRHLALDGHFGHNQAVLMARANDLHLISKLRRDAVLFEKHEGEYAGRGRRKRYGEKFNYDCLPEKYRRQTESEGEIVTNYYQGILLSRSFAAELNVVVIEKTNIKTGKRARAVLFSSDVELSWEKLVECYGLRFQIEFNFRDAKQHFGLEDFMTRTARGVENAANLSFLMVNLSEKLLEQSDGGCFGMNDLKSWFRGIKYAVETIKLVEPKAERILIEKVTEVIGRIGSIHRHKYSVSSA